MFSCWMLEEEGCVEWMVWTVRWDQVTPVVRGKIRHKFEMKGTDGQLGECNSEGASYHGGAVAC